MSTAWHNRFLFSHHYLEELCQDADDRTEAAHLVDALRGWTGSWDDRTLSKLIGTQVGPTLVSLGFTYGEPAAGEDPHRLHLYASYRKEQQLGVCYVAHREDGEADLDSTIKGRHYAAEIVHALQEDELSWGLLTDGKRWRLYRADELAPYETYLEIDLAPVLQGHGGGEAGDAAFLLHTLFRKAAFERAEDGACALDEHLAASQQAASRIEKHLSGCIEEVLRDLCQGFVERDGKASYTSAERDEVFRNATVLLYRMLFMLYAEARELLPRDEPTYVPVSLDALVEQAVDYVRGNGLPDPDGTELWQALSNLSSWISSGNDERQIPAYNGDLFDDSDKHYIHDQTIADKYLAPALFSLGSLEDEATQTGARRIDYRDLSVRHLGSIYEGLLEYKLFIAQEQRVRRADGKGGYNFPKLSETRLKKGEEENVIEVGDVYFANSAGERKAMGAYYTPEYIVDYIVKQTVLRGLQERRALLEEQLPGWIADVKAAPPGDRARLQAVVDQKLIDFVEQEVLTFRVCDPAMGSGHFLVNTVHGMTNFIVETLNLTPWENPKIDCDPVLWRRRVAKRCLYGVDLNELAVELAKLSLWLTTVAQGKPLSFLDHHLRHGNSLIGTRLEELIKVLSPKTDQDQASANGQLSMFDAYPAFRVPLMEALDLMRDISARIADAAEDVEAQAADYAQLRRELKPYRDLADLLTARHFGVDVDEAQVRAIAHQLLDADLELSDADRILLDRACDVAHDQHFFHWDLEFPEVFLDKNHQPRSEEIGFSAIVGNPPYGRYGMVTEWQRDFLRAQGFSYGSGDVAEAFFDQALRLLSDRGIHSFIMPKPLTYVISWSGIRCRILGSVQLERITDVSKAFEDVLYEQVIVTSRNQKSETKSVSVDVLGGQKTKTFSVPKRLFTKYFFPAHLVESEVSIGAKLASSCCSAGTFYDCWYGKGGAVPKLRQTGDIEVLQGRQIGHYIINTSAFPRVFLRQADVTSKENKKRRRKKIVVQDIVAHVTTPYPHIQIAAAIDTNQRICLNTLTCFAKKTDYYLLTLLAILNSRLVSWYAHKFIFNCAVRTMHFMPGYADRIPIPKIKFATPPSERSQLTAKVVRDYESSVLNQDSSSLMFMVSELLDNRSTHFDVVHDLLAYLAKQMIEFHKQRQTLEQHVDLFHYIDQGEPFICITDAFVLDESCRTDEEMDLEKVHHDIDDLRLTPNADGTWTLDLQAKFRDPEQGWQEWIKEEDGYSIKRRWVPAYRLKMSEEKARFYRYALPRLQEFDNARSFPGGYTRSTLKKLHLTRVPMMPDVDLSELARLDRELTETKRKIRLTDDLIDQIVYKLYGLTEEEIAIVEGRA